MSFTRRHYEETARIIAETKDKFSTGNALLFAQSRLSAMFAADNPRFDAEKFAKACEPGSAK